MCLSIPGKVVKIEKDKAIIDYSGEKSEAYNLINAEVGDYVVVQMKRVIMKVSEKEALKSIKAWKSIQ